MSSSIVNEKPRLEPNKKQGYNMLSKIDKHGSIFQKVKIEPNNGNLIFDSIPSFIDVDFYSIQVSDNSRLITVHIINNALRLIYKNNNNIPLIFYFQSNHTDIMLSLPCLLDLSIQLKCDIITFDYAGFGSSTGKLSIKETIKHSKIIFNEFICKYLNKKIKYVNLMCKGIGAIFCLNLAGIYNGNNEYKNQTFSSVIMIEPIINEYYIELTTLQSISSPSLLISNKKKNYSLVSLARQIADESEIYECKKYKILGRIKEFIDEIEEDTINTTNNINTNINSISKYSSTSSLIHCNSINDIVYKNGINNNSTHSSTYAESEFSEGNTNNINNNNIYIDEFIEEYYDDFEY